MHLLKKWTWKMAYRDARPARLRLLLFSASIIFGVAALVTIGSLRQNLNTAVGSQSKSLLGADLLITSRQPYKPETQKLLNSIPGERATETSFSTMITIGDNPAPRLVGIRGLDSAFPFYGKIATAPENAWQTIQTTPGVIVEKSFLQTMDGKIGDLAKFGDLELPIIATLERDPPSASGFAAFTPTVITTSKSLTGSNLLGSKSLAFYRTYFKTPPNIDPDKIVNAIETQIAEQSLRTLTAKKRSESVEKAINQLYTFLNLIGFSALFLGGIGVAGAIYVHISERLKNVATLRCLGCTATQAFSVYLAQAITMGIIGSLLGVLTGVGIIYILQAVISSLPPNSLPIPVTLSPDFLEISKAAFIGFIISIIFALLPLLAIRRVSPLQALRPNNQALKKQKRDPLKLLIFTSLAAFIFAITWLDSKDLTNGWKPSLAYLGFLIITFGVLALTGKILRFVCKKITRPTWPFTIRQGFASLHRQNNQTGLFMLSIGLGVFLIFTLLLTQNVLQQWLSPDNMKDKPNIFVVDVPPEDISNIQNKITAAGATPLNQAPIIQMRITSIKGRSTSEILTSETEADKKIPRWVLSREFRSTYRNEITNTEKLLTGSWTPDTSNIIAGQPIPISIEQDIAKDLNVTIGDELKVTIEGFDETIPIKIASVREVDWRSMDLNFFLVFPEGVLEPYVSFNVLTARSPNDAATAAIQQNVFKTHPYINIVDLSLILKTIQSVLNGASKAIQYMSLFTLLTGSVVLIASIMAGRRTRIEQSILLRTLGASRKQITKILATEYILLATLATLTGVLLSIIAVKLLATKIFEGDPYTLPWQTIIIASLTIIIITTVLGMLLSRGITKHPPLQILRQQ